MKLQNLGLKTLLLAVTLSLSGLVSAKPTADIIDTPLDTVVIGDMFYTCQHTCVVNIFSDGGYSITDSQDGWMRAKKMNLTHKEK